MALLFVPWLEKCRAKFAPQPTVHPFCQIVAAGLMALATAACASPDRYMGISLRPGGADPKLQKLAGHARIGNKQAQLALGVVFEEGLGVPVNRKRAATLYRRAAEDTRNTYPIFRASSADTPMVNFVDIDKDFVPGLPDARIRLEQLAGVSH